MEEWTQYKLIDVLDTLIDYRGKTPIKKDSGIFLVTAKNVKDGYIDYGISQEYIAEEDYEEVDCIIVDDGSFCLLGADSGGGEVLFI